MPVSRAHKGTGSREEAEEGEDENRDSTGLLEKLMMANYYLKSNALLGTVHSLLNEIHT